MKLGSSQELTPTQKLILSKGKFTKIKDIFNKEIEDTVPENITRSTEILKCHDIFIHFLSFNPSSAKHRNLIFHLLLLTFYRGLSKDIIFCF